MRLLEVLSNRCQQNLQLMHILRMDISCTAMAFLLPTFGKRAQEEIGVPSKRKVTVWTPTTTKATIESVQNDPPMQASSSATGPDDATEHVAAEADAEVRNLHTVGLDAEPDVTNQHVAAAVETTMSMQAIVTEWAAFSTDEAREIVHAAQIILKGKQNDLRNLCKPWGVQLKAQRRYRSTASIKQDLKMALTKHVLNLKSKTEAATGSSATEHPITEDRTGAVVVAAAVENSSLPARSIASSSSAGSTMELTQSQQGGPLLQSRETHTELATNNFPNLFESPEADVVNALGWAHANTTHPHVAACLLACRQWESAVATKEHQNRNKRRKLCKDHDIPCIKAVDSNKELDAAMVYIRGQLIDRIKNIRAARLSIQPLLQSNATSSTSGHSMQQRSASVDTAVHPPAKKRQHHQDNKLHNYFTPRAAGDGLPEIEELHIPDMATDLTSTYLRLHKKRQIYADDNDLC